MSLTINGNLNLPTSTIRVTRGTINQIINGHNAGSFTRTAANLRNYSTVYINVPRGTGILKIRVVRNGFLGIGNLVIPIYNDSIGTHNLGWHGYEARTNVLSWNNINQCVGNIFVRYIVNSLGHASVQLTFANFRNQRGWTNAPIDDSITMNFSTDFTHIPYGIRANNMLPRAFVTWQNMGAGNAQVDNRFNLNTIFGSEFDRTILRGLYVIPRWYQHNQIIPIHGGDETPPIALNEAQRRELQQRTVELRQNNFNNNSFNRFNFRFNPLRFTRGSGIIRVEKHTTRLQTAWGSNPTNSANIGCWIVAL